jgi:DNA-binding CsgD family transcriptional regulator
MNGNSLPYVSNSPKNLTRNVNLHVMTQLSHPWIRELYAAALDTRYEDFARLAMLRAATEFDCVAVLWGGDCEPRSVALNNAVDTGWMQSLNLDAETLQRDVAPLSVSVNVVESGSRGERHVLAFFRRRNGFAEAEQGDLRAVAEHLVGAEMVARECARRVASSTAVTLDPDLGHATVDANGVIVAADQRFRELLLQVEPQNDGRQVPFPLPEADGARVVHMRGMHVRLQRQGGEVQVRMRRDRRAAMLSLRELQIAEKVAQGMTFKEIARELTLAQSTVSTHVYNIYAKLGIRRRYDLVQWLSSTAVVESA